MFEKIAFLQNMNMKLFFKGAQEFKINAYATSVTYILLRDRENIREKGIQINKQYNISLN